MFSPRLFAFLALAAFAAAYPASDEPIPRPITTIMETDFEDASPWFRFPAFGNIFAPLTKLFSSFADIGPRIEADDDKFRVTVNVKDYKKEDLKVKVKNDFIFVQGAHEAKQDEHDLFASQFFHTYSLPENASASDVTAKLTSDGFLVVDAPLNGNDEKSKDKVVEREVPIVESDEPLQKDDKIEKVDNAIPAVAPVEIDEVPKITTELPTTSADIDDERKEPTTPSDREEVTVRDNSIPSNEANEISGANEIQP
ncbi:heat shock protein 67B1-like [Vanessa atalanta]|uniref:heat shock protein 67B1-like n=1 Tax=Vanessa atalanta TaxID=42275 RepID=UPI001FCD52D8|nr:heat shock protein 67B1-like [Vanessa atalanta]